MSSNEEYLDNLLASVMKQESSPEEPQMENMEDFLEDLDSMEAKEDLEEDLKSALEMQEDSLDLNTMEGEDVNLSTLEDLEDDLDLDLDLDALDDNLELNEASKAEEEFDLDLEALDDSDLKVEDVSDLDLDLDLLSEEDSMEETPIVPENSEEKKEESILTSIEESVEEAEQASIEEREEADDEATIAESIEEANEESTEPALDVEDITPDVSEEAEETKLSEDSMDNEIEEILNSVSEEIDASEDMKEMDFEKYEEELDKVDDDDLLNLGELDDESEINEISGLLDHSDDGWDDDDELFAELSHAPKINEKPAEAVSEPVAVPAQEEPVVEKEKPKKEKKVKIKKQKVKKEKKVVQKVASDAPQKSKEGFFAKLFKSMTEEDVIPEPTEEEIAEAKAAKEAKKKEQDEAKEAKKKEQDEAKEAKKKAKEEAKAQKAKAAEEKKKAKAEAKEARLAEQKAKERGKKKKYVSKKKVLLIAVFAATVLGSILFMVNSAATHSALKRAREAFYTGDYELTYLSMYGENLGESDSIMYEKSRIVLKLERKLDAYVNNLKLGNELKALNSLVQGIGIYERTKEEAVTIGAIDEFDLVKNQILAELSTNYGLDEAQVMQLLQIQDENSYTKTLNHIIMGENVALTDIESIVNDEKNAAVQEESPYGEPRMVEEPDFDEELEALDE